MAKGFASWLADFHICPHADAWRFAALRLTHVARWAANYGGKPAFVPALPEAALKGRLPLALAAPRWAKAKLTASDASIDYTDLSPHVSLHRR